MLTRCTLNLTPGFPLLPPPPGPLRFGDDDPKDDKKSDKSKDDKSKDDPKPDDKPADRGWPADTPVKDMTPEQQAAYHAFHARKHENRVKEYGDLTPDEVKKLKKDYDELKAATQSDQDKAIEEAKEEGRREVRAVLEKERAKSALEKALTGRNPDAGALLELDLSTFIKDGSVDTDAVNTWVTEHSTEGTNGGGRKAAPDLGGGKRGSLGAEKGVAAGRDLYESVRGKKTTTKTDS